MTLLTKRLVEKPWGKDTLPLPFVAPQGKRIGEVWFEPPPEMPSVLVKYIFTSEKLSVQVHPSDAQAVELGESGRGKEECWLVIGAEPGATLGIGFKQPIDAETMYAAALDGSIEDLMEWYPVEPGDFFYIPSGTVHAIGAGVSLIEIQQNSDITYRLYDYGRPRELHLDKGIAIARGVPHDADLRRHVPVNGNIELAKGPYFSVARVDGNVPDVASGRCLIIPIDGSVDLGKEGLVEPGECALVQSVSDVVRNAGSRFLVVHPA